MISWAADEAKNYPYGQNLGFEPENAVIHWMGKSSMQWCELLTELSRDRSMLESPDILIIHLGGSDLGHASLSKLLNSVHSVIPVLLERYPNTTFAWSMMIPRSKWMMTPMEKTRKRFNRVIFDLVWKAGFKVIRHKEIENKFNARKQSPGHTNEDLDLFNVNLMDFIRQTLTGVKETDTA